MALYVWPTESVTTTITGVATEATLLDVKTSVQLLDDTISTNVHTGLKEIQVVATGHVCAENSTTTELAGGGVFTGSAWQDCLNYGTIVVSVFADQASATNGMVIQWSADGTNIMDTDVFTISANVGKTFSFGTASRYIRVVYTNGATLQGTFILQTMLKPGYTKPSSHRLEDSLNGQDDAELVKAILAARNPAGNYLNIDCTTGGNLKVSLEELDGGVTMPVSGTVTANAGTNLNTSALAVESGGNLAALLTKTSGALIPVSYDNIAVDLSGATTDVYTYKVAAATVATLTITYSDATKATITTIVRT